MAEGYISGLHQSPYKGHSLEFAQHRQYTFGDSLKYLDWKIYGRTDRFYVKQFQEETNLRGYCVIDTSSSMDYASGEVSKLEYASYLAAAITYLMIKQRDSAGLITFSENIEEFVPPRSHQAHMHQVMNKLEKLPVNKKTDFSNSFNQIGRKIKKRSLLVIFSDFLEEPEKLIRALKYFPYRKNDVIAFNILDPDEINLPHEGSVEYIDSESSARFKTRPAVIRKEYQKKIKEHLKILENSMRNHGIDYYSLTTDIPLDKAFSRFIEGRKRFAL